jgi:hypothetical protein
MDGALRPRGIAVTTVRFGFVDTKMAKSPVTPFMISVERATDVLMRAYAPGRRWCPTRAGWLF